MEMRAELLASGRGQICLSDVFNIQSEQGLHPRLPNAHLRVSDSVKVKMRLALVCGIRKPYKQITFGPF